MKGSIGDTARQINVTLVHPLEPGHPLAYAWVYPYICISVPPQPFIPAGLSSMAGKMCADNRYVVDIKGAHVFRHLHQYPQADRGPDLSLDRNPVKGLDDVPGGQEGDRLHLPCRLQYVQEGDDRHASAFNEHGLCRAPESISMTPSQQHQQ